ncbi:MAG: YdbL family protein, partial [Cohaesibacter sp.]|nr:YdbL family protein [Cohaesibacter sp.]
MKKLIAVAAMLMFSLNALALDLGSAKAQGLVGEQRDGLLGVVKTPASAEVKSLVASINKKRKAKFAATAGKTGGTVAQVAARFAT